MPIAPPTSGPGIDAAPDLRVDEPHPLDCSLQGYAWIPRMLDKARATLAGTAGRYQFGCPVDHTCMALLGVTPEVVLDLAARHADDEAVLAWLLELGIPTAREAWFDGRAVEDELQETDVYLRVRRRDELDDGVFAGREHGADVSVVLVELEAGAVEDWHAHPGAEVVVVTRGSATFFLGERQARIIRADEVVRIPAGVRHRVVNTGREVLRAVSVHAGGDIAVVA